MWPESQKVVGSPHGQLFEVHPRTSLFNSLIDLGIWLKIFDADTEEDIEKLLELEVPIVQQTICAYRELMGDSEFLRLVCQ